MHRGVGMPQGKQLVLEHLEGVSANLWRSHSKILRQHIGGRPGIYALYRRKRLVYVGLAKYVGVRLNQHLRDDLAGGWDHFSVYLTAREDHIAELESLVLRIIMPRGNKAAGSLARSKDLGPEVERALQELSASSPPRKQRRGGPRGTRRVLQGRRGGRPIRATLHPDGTITYARRIHTSPSGAASAALGRTCDGWTFWHYKDDATGEWVALNKLRP